MADTVIVKCASHRARHRLQQLLGYKPQAYYATPMFTAPAPTGGFYEIPLDKLEQAKLIKGITKASNRWGYCRCWDTSTSFNGEGQ